MTTSIESVCTPVELPPDLLLESAEYAWDINSRNMPHQYVSANGEALSKAELAALSTNYWGSGGRKLTVGWLDSPNAATRRLILEAANLWGQHGNIQFVESNADSDIRIARQQNDGYWSYVGPQLLRVPRGQATMNLAGVTESFRDWFIVTHEFGHSAGLQHEQLRQSIVSRINREAAYAYFWRTSRWSRQTVDQNVLTPLEANSVMGSTVTDPISVMCYSLPANIMNDGIAVPGGRELSPIDRSFFGELYPLTTQPPPPPPVTGGTVSMTLYLESKEVVMSLPAGWKVRNG